jgi:hypothetical protein
MKQLMYEMNVPMQVNQMGPAHKCPVGYKLRSSCATQVWVDFGDATGLCTNFSKSSVTPIHCEDFNVANLAASLGCPITQFPCRYLGMPLSDRRLRKNDLQPILDKLRNKVRGWIPGLFAIDARLVLVKHILVAMPIFQMLAIAPPIWLSKAMDKISRGFFRPRKRR